MFVPKVQTTWWQDFFKNADFQPLIGTLGAMAPDMIYFSVFVKEDISLAKTA